MRKFFNGKLKIYNSVQKCVKLLKIAPNRISVDTRVMLLHRFVHLHRLSTASFPPIISKWPVTFNSRFSFSSELIHRMKNNKLVQTTCLSQQGRRILSSKAQNEKIDGPLKTTLGEKTDLECDITYPTSGDRLFTPEGKKRPVVVLIGWLGSVNKSVAKFGSIYEESYITLRCSIPAVNILRRSHRLPHISQQLLREIKRIGLNEHPTFFVIFSNGGAIFYQQISLAMQRAGSPLPVKGIIFDSAPSERSMLRTFMACRVAYQRQPLNLLMSIMDTMIFSLNCFREEIFKLFGKTDIVTTKAMHLIDEPYLWPQIFLYSNLDVLIPANDVEKFASERAKRGVRTQLIMFMNTGHLRHLFSYRNEYINIVHRFINECLTEKHTEISGGIHKKVVNPDQIAEEGRPTPESN